jgi:hypothetical protein
MISGSTKKSSFGEAAPVSDASLQATELWNPVVQIDSATLRSTVDKGATEEPYPELEILRHECLRTLRTRYTKLCEKVGIEPPPDTFERWQFRAVIENKGSDPLIPEGTSSDPDFIEMLTSAGASIENASALSDSMSRFATKITHTMSRRISRLGTSKKIKCSLDGNMYKLKLGSTSLVITKQHYEKLQTLHRMAGGGSTKEFLTHLFCILLRYHSLQGDFTQGAGFQAAINNDCFDVLLKHFDVKMECFASPFNSRYRSFCRYS